MWQHLLVRWTLDVMYCEMNLAKNFLKKITGKKDNVKVRWDLQQKGIHLHLWFIANPRRGQKMLKPAAPYVLSNGNFVVFAQTLELLKMPSGYASNVGKHIRNKKHGALKPHAYHVLMQ